MISKFEKKVVKPLSLPKGNFFCHVCRTFYFFLEPSILERKWEEKILNTSTVSKILGVSQSTVQRWVKHLNLQMERNEYGHYIYTEEDVEQLKLFQKQLQQGIPIRKIVAPQNKQRIESEKETQLLSEKIAELEKKIDNKADSVVSYQLLQHRQEIEELKKQLDVALKKIAQLEESRSKEDRQISFHHSPQKNKQTNEKERKKGLFKILFNY